MKILLTESQVKKMVKGLHNQWKEVDGKLIRIYDFPTYKDTINFVNKVAEISTEQNHHPDMVVGFDTVKVIMFDHDKGGISDKCHKFTDAVDKMVDNEESLDEASRSFAFTRKKRLFPKSAMMANPDRFKEYDKEVKGINESDPKKGTGKKPEGSDRRLYTDENPNDTVSVKFKTKEDIVDTLNKESFKSKPHKRQSQIINLIHQRVRAAYQNASDPETKKRLKRGLDYIEIQKEKSKEKTIKLQNEGLLDTSWENDEGDKVTLMDLLNATENIPVSEVDLEVLKPHLLTWEGDEEERGKIDKADLQYPILIFVENDGSFISIIDGHHRAQKAVKNKLGTIKAKVIPINSLSKDIRKVFSHMGKQEEMKEGELTEKCWAGYTQKGMKTMFGKEYPNCVKKKK